MEKHIRQITATILIIGLTCLLGGCHNLIKEKEAVVTKIEKTDYHNYKYKITINACIADQILYTNTKFEIGDTVKFSK